MIEKTGLYENRKVKRMLFDAAGVPGWHYFLCDHAESVRVIARLPNRASSLCSRGLSAVIPPDSVAQADVSAGIFMIRTHNLSKTLSNRQSTRFAF